MSCLKENLVTDTNYLAKMLCLKFHRVQQLIVMKQFLYSYLIFLLAVTTVESVNSP